MRTSRTRWSLAALATAALVGPAHAQDCNIVHCITGDQTAGSTVTVYNQDVYIYNVNVVPGSSPGARTFTVRAYNGSIVVGDGVSGPQYGIAAGRSGGGPNFNGADGQSCNTGQQPNGPATGATAAKAGYNVVLETLPYNGGTNPLSISIYDPVSTAGGNGGNGAAGCNEQVYPDNHCAIYGAQGGTTATAGASGGTITIRGSGNIDVSSLLDSSGGSGGNGAAGGGGHRDSPGAASPGAAGANGGAIAVSHTTSAPITATCSVSYYYGGVDSSGGRGGNGGDGNSGNGTASAAAGANGGKGGGVSFSVRTLSVGSSIYTRGGDGGNGGISTGGRNSGWVSYGNCNLTCGEPEGEDCCYRYWGVPYPGGNAGAAGNGGSAGAITVTVSVDFSLGLYASLFARGGDGGNAGQPGQPGTGDSTCMHNCAACPTVQTGGASANGGAGGAGGKITVNVTGNFSGSGLLKSSGGDGGDGSHGAHSTPVCRRKTVTCDGDACPEENPCCGPLIVCGASAPHQGGAGGNGGPGATISVIVGGTLSTTLVYEFCGGEPGHGGNGGNGVRHYACNVIQWETGPANGGPGGMKGASGSLYRGPGYPTMICASAIDIDDDPIDPNAGNPGIYGSGCVEP